MTAQELLRGGRLQEAIAAVTAQVRDRPTDYRTRTFLFELLCFAGEWERARKQLSVVAQESPESETGALLLRSAIAADFKRQQVYEGGDVVPGPPPGPCVRAGTLNGKPFRSIEDADPRVGGRLEVFLAGEHLLLPFDAIGAMKIAPPATLRDTLWAPAEILASPSYRDRELGELLIPVLYPHSFRHAREEVRLGRATEWDGDVPFGQRLLVLDDGEEVIPILEVRELMFASTGQDAEVQAVSG